MTLTGCKEPLTPRTGSVSLLCTQREERSGDESNGKRGSEGKSTVCEQKDKICADSFLARGPEH